MDKNYNTIADYYSRAFKNFGDTPAGLAWQSTESMNTRFKIMAELIKRNGFQAERGSLLDFGCGTGKFLEYLGQHYVGIYPLVTEYLGVDSNAEIIKYCKDYKFKINPVATSLQPFIQENNPLPYSFRSLNILTEDVPDVDYCVINGVFTVKDSLPWDEMWSFFTQTIDKLFKRTKVGMAFNLMSTNVDWQREDLFHVSLDKLTEYLAKNLSRNFVIRNDYKLYEYTTYVFK